MVTVRRTGFSICAIMKTGSGRDRRANMSGDKQQRIKQRAYEIWETAGRPHGAHEVHWLQATREIEAEDAVPADKPKRAKAAATPKAAAAPKAAVASKASAPKAAPKTPAKPKAK
jgi:Protein of unknown function (DUF2934)